MIGRGNNNSTVVVGMAAGGKMDGSLIVVSISDGLQRWSTR